MTNEQLSVFLHNLHRRLAAAFDHAVESLPDEAKQERQNFMNQTYLVVPALGELSDVIDDIERDVKALCKK